MPVPNTFANATSAIPLSQLDNNFATAITLGNTAIQLGNTVTTLNNMTMANVTISSVSTPITVAQGGTGLTTATAANNAIYSTAAGTLTAGTLPVAAGGTGATTLTSNNVLIGNGTGAVSFVAPGTSGNVLTSNGTAWTSTAAAGGGSWILLSTVTASGASTADVETTFSSTYDVYALVITGVYSSSNGDTFQCLLKVGGTYQTSNYQYHIGFPSAQSASYSGASAVTQSSILLAQSGVVSNTASRAYDAVMFIHNAASTTISKKFHLRGEYITASGGTDKIVTLSLSGAYYESGVTGTAALTGVRFSMASGTTTGTFRLYGIKNS